MKSNIIATLFFCFIAVFFVSCNFENGVGYHYDDEDFDSVIWKANKESGEVSSYNKKNPRGQMFDSLKASSDFSTGKSVSDIETLLGDPEEKLNNDVIYRYYLGVWGVFYNHQYLVVFFVNDKVDTFFIHQVPVQ